METQEPANDNHEPDAVRQAREIRDLAKEDARLAHADGNVGASRLLSKVSVALTLAIVSGAFALYNK